MSDDPLDYFGVWSVAGIGRVSSLLESLGVRFEVNECVETEDVLREWCAWDENAANPHIGLNLWVHSDDRAKVGDKIVAMFPKRKFGA
jgi:hypothetical protein